MSPEPVITITRDIDGSFTATPAAITIDASSFAIPEAGRTGHFRVATPAGWQLRACGPLRWEAIPRRLSPGCRARFTLHRMSSEERKVGSAAVQTRLDLQNALDIRRSILPLPNRAAVLGEVNPTRAIFNETFLPMPEPLNRLLFEGLYADVVFLRSEGRRGGVCSGMAHWAIARASGIEPKPQGIADAVERIALFHGRQLRDRALLNSLPWFLRGSSRAVFNVVRRDLLRTGLTDRAIDLAIPKLWRRDITSAVVAEGHVVVPVRLVQESLERGFIEVYDPNAPEALLAEPPRVIHFDLKRNRYAYVHRVDFDDTNVGMIANRQSAYAGRGTAILALLASLLFTPRRGMRSLFRGQKNARA